VFGINLPQWLRFSRNRSARRPVRTRTSLHLEALEDRLVPSTVSGTVFQDQTGNGLSSDDTGMNNVKVVLYKDTNGTGLLGAGDAVVGTQQTGSDGSFSFGNLAAGTYFVAEATPSGFVRTAPTNAAYLTVNLADDQTTAANNVFDNFQKPSTGAITNVSFTITDPTGNTHTVTNLRGNTHQGDTVTVNFTVTGTSPVQVSLVTYDAPGATFNASTASQQVIVDEESQLLSPGDHSFTVHLPDNFYQVDLVAGPAIDHFGPAGSNIFYSAQSRLISADNEGTQAFVPGSISGVAFNDVNTNGIYQPTNGDTTLAGVAVTLTGVNDLGQTVTLTTTTDANGNYSFTGLREGTYTLSWGGVGSDSPETPATSAVPPGAIPSSNGFTGTVSSIVIGSGTNLTINLPEIAPIPIA
jgi:hypothetical protein